jgi:hypothetical protein
MAITRISNIASTIPDGSIANEKLSDIVNFKNIIINGDMSIAQRGTSEASVGNSFTYFTVDRFKLGGSGSSGARFTMSQDTDVPTGQGFATSLKMDLLLLMVVWEQVIHFKLLQRIEGQNLQYLKKGTSSAESTTLSFWVKSNKTGTYIAELRDTDNSRTISKAYTIDSASTWEKKTLTFEGDTTGAFNNDNGESLRLIHWLYAGTDYTSGTLQTSWGTLTANRAVGQVNLADSTANDFYITGIQLEAGTTASDFEFLPVDVNLARCQRYYYVHVNGSGQHVSLGALYTSAYLVAEVSFPVEMRSVPSLISGVGTDYYRFYRNGTNDQFDRWSVGISRATKVSM